MRRPPLELAGATAVLTGAAQGIGRALARLLASARCNLALIDRQAAELGVVAEECRRQGVTVSSHTCDLADPAAINGAVQELVAIHGPPTLLINNTGIALVGRFDQVSDADMQEVFATNFWGTIRLTRALLPSLLSAGGPTQIANMCSIYGMIAPPGHVAYAASKFAVRGFSEALAHELAATSVGVSVVGPDHVCTGMAAQARCGPGITPRAAALAVEQFTRLMQIDAETAARVVLVGRRET